MVIKRIMYSLNESHVVKQIHCLEWTFFARNLKKSQIVVMLYAAISHKWKSAVKCPKPHDHGVFVCSSCNFEVKL